MYLSEFLWLEQSEIIHHLIGAGLDSTVVDAFDKTAVHYARQNEYFEAARWCWLGKKLFLQIRVVFITMTFYYKNRVKETVNSSLKEPTEIVMVSIKQTLLYSGPWYLFLRDFDKGHFIMKFQACKLNDSWPPKRLVKNHVNLIVHIVSLWPVFSKQLWAYTEFRSLAIWLVWWRQS